MKTILFDFISLQDSYINGGFEYTFKVLTSLLAQNVQILALCDKNKGFMDKVQQVLDAHNIKKIAINQIQQKDFAKNYNISLFFVGVAQRYNNIDLSKLDCPIYMVCHDINDLVWLYGKKLCTKEFSHFASHNYKNDFCAKKLYKKIRYTLGEIYYTHFAFKSYALFAKTIQQKNVHLITVSNFSKHAIEYNFAPIANDILVFYSPQKEIQNGTQNYSKIVQEIIATKQKKYFLLVSCNRLDKNATLFIHAWEHFCKATNYEFYAVLVGKIDIQMQNLICVPYVKDAELELLYQNAYAFVYPSIAEGFGYPPVEAMKYATPCICANVTSVPEVCGDGVLYFSPFYPEDLYKAMLTLIKEYDLWQAKAKTQYNVIAQKQQKDLSLLVDLLCRE